jgi:hypothetical protein
VPSSLLFFVVFVSETVTVASDCTSSASKTLSSNEVDCVVWSVEVANHDCYCVLCCKFHCCCIPPGRGTCAHLLLCKNKAVKLSDPSPAFLRTYIHISPRNQRSLSGYWLPYVEYENEARTDALIGLLSAISVDSSEVVRWCTPAVVYNAFCSPQPTGCSTR